MSGQIVSLEQLEAAIADTRALICPSSHAWNRPRPAAFFINMSGVILIRLFRQGLFVYEKGGKSV